MEVGSAMIAAAAMQKDDKINQVLRNAEGEC